MVRHKRIQYAALLWALVASAMVAASAFPSYVDHLDPAFRDLGCEGCHAAGSPDSVVLKAKRIAEGDRPALDGVEDPVWGGAQFIRINLSGGFDPLAQVGEDGFSARGAPLPWATGNSTTLTIRALYTDSDLFMEFQWLDPGVSEMRQPWVFNGTTHVWEQLPAIPYYEDKLSVLWEIGQVTGFDTGGCLVTCHATTLNRTAPLKYTPVPGEFVDMWHWKSVRENAVNQVDDQYVDYNTTRLEAGRIGDPNDNASLGYKDNKQTLSNGTANVTVPTYWIPGRAGYWYILKSDINSHVAKHITSVDSANVLHDEDGTAVPSGVFIPGIYISAYTGDRGDIVGHGNWAANQWTLELARKLVTVHNGTKSPYDVQFEDMSKKYYFGVAVFDNAQIGHMWQPGPFRLQFGEAAKPVPANLDVWGTSVGAASFMVSGLGALALVTALAKRAPSKASKPDAQAQAAGPASAGGKGGER